MEQRACYRVATHLALEQFQLSLELPDGRSYPARMEDVSARGLMARLQSAVRPALSEGARLGLRLSCPTRGISFQLSATVRGIQSSVDQLCCGLAFVRPEGLEGSLPPDLFSLFNRRRSPRTAVVRSERALTLAALAGRRALGSLRDLSMSGASISIPQAEDPGFALGERITIAGRFDESGPASALIAHVRRIRSAPGAVLYGIEFDWEHADRTGQQSTLERLLARTATPASPVPGDLPQGARRIAERRISMRARSSLEEPIEVVMIGDGNRKASATLRDLSASGAGVVVRALEDPEFGFDESMQLRLLLPGGSLGMVARVRRGLLIDDEVCYGLEFDVDATEDFETHQERILDYLAQQLGEVHTPPLIACS